MNHRLTIQKSFADDIISGRKTFEVRRSDRNIKEGDTVVIDEFGSLYITHPIADKTYLVTYTLHGWGIKDDHMAFSFQEIEKETLSYYDGDVLIRYDKTLPKKEAETASAESKDSQAHNAKSSPWPWVRG